MQLPYPVIVFIGEALVSLHRDLSKYDHVLLVDALRVSAFAIAI